MNHLTPATFYIEFVERLCIDRGALCSVSIHFDGGGGVRISIWKLSPIFRAFPVLVQLSHVDAALASKTIPARHRKSTYTKIHSGKKL